MADFSPAGFAAHLAAHVAKMEAHVASGLEHGARLIEAEARKEIGVYQAAAGQFAPWAELADATKADRVARGFSENDPLLRDGTLRDSIGHHVTVYSATSGEAVIGSNSEIAVYQELGTARIPPRSFLGGAAFRKSGEVVKALGDHVVLSLTGQSVPKTPIG